MRMDGDYGLSEKALLKWTNRGCVQRFFYGDSEERAASGAVVPLRSINDD